MSKLEKECINKKEISLIDCKGVKEFGYEPIVGITPIYIDERGEWFFIDFQTKKRINVNYE